jgi:hypothetical protein
MRMHSILLALAWGRSPCGVGASFAEPGHPLAPGQPLPLHRSSGGGSFVRVGMSSLGLDGDKTEELLLLRLEREAIGRRRAANDEESEPAAAFVDILSTVNVLLLSLLLVATAMRNADPPVQTMIEQQTTGQVHSPPTIERVRPSVRPSTSGTEEQDATYMIDASAGFFFY